MERDRGAVRGREDEPLLRPLPDVREPEVVRDLLLDTELCLFPLVRDLPLVRFLSVMLVPSLISKLSKLVDSQLLSPSPIPSRR